METILLRPHHINCIYFYKGFGYDKKFIENMNYILDSLFQNKYNIKFVKECDVLCKACPNRIKNECKTEKHVKKLDDLTIKNYNLYLDKIYSFNEIYEKYYKNFDYKKFTNICSSCEWFKKGICSKEKQNFNCIDK